MKNSHDNGGGKRRRRSPGRLLVAMAHACPGFVPLAIGNALQVILALPFYAVPAGQSVRAMSWAAMAGPLAVGTALVGLALFRSDSLHRSQKISGARGNSPQHPVIGHAHGHAVSCCGNQRI